MKTADNSILREIEASKGFDTALLTTFNFEISFFERTIFMLLLKNEIRNINLFVDANQLSEAVSIEQSMLLGKHYFVSPISIGGAFHPKVILLLGKEKAKLIVSSANIKTTGYMLNSEVYSVFDYDNEHRQFGSLIKSAIEFFKGLYKLAPVQDKEVLGELQTFKLGEIEDNDNYVFVSNLDTPILDQAVSIIRKDNRNIQSINIAVPFYDASLSALKQIRDLFSCRKMNLYIQHQKSTFPVEYYNSIMSDFPLTIHPFQEMSANRYSFAFYHGKVFEFVSDHEAHYLYGSPNCTASALMRTYRETGNIECCIIAKEIEEDKGLFFHTFEVNHELKLESGSFSDEKTSKGEYSFSYGELKDGEVCLYFNGPTSYSLRAEYNSQSVPFGVSDDRVFVKIPSAMIMMEETILDITLTYKNTSQVINCWFLNRIELERFRIASVIARELPDLINDDDDERYTEFMVPLIEAIDTDEFKEYQQNQAQMLIKFREIDNAEEDDVTQGFLLEEDAPDDYREHKRCERLYLKTVVLANRYYSSLLPFRENHSDLKSEPGLAYPPRSTEERPATSAERRFARLYKRYVKSHLMTVDPDSFTYEYYKNLIGVFFDACKRLYYRGDVKDFLGLDFILQAKMKFVQILTAKGMKQYAETGELDEVLLAQALNTIVERGYHRSPKLDETQTKNLLLDINQLFNIRESFPTFIKQMDLKDLKIPDDAGYDAIAYIDSLFGYKTLTQVNDYFRKLYGDGFELQENDSTVTVAVPLPVNAKAPSNFGNIHAETILRSFKHYGKKVTKLNFIYKEMTGRIVAYEIIPSGTTVGVVKQVMINKGKTVSYKCRKSSDNTWRPIYFR